MKKWFIFASCGALVASLAAACGTTDSSVFGTPSNGLDASFNSDATIVIGMGDAGRQCTPLTCAQLGATCGPQGDGCGGTIASCGTCAPPDFCGGGGPSKCGKGTVDAGGAIEEPCVPATCDSLAVNCGDQGDGCGHVIHCGTCTSPEICGGGGSPSVCGPVADGGMASNCVPTKTSCENDDCGPIANGCGALLQCGTCSAPNVCGGGIAGAAGTPSKCGGTLPDGGSGCVPRTCASAGANCGPIGDGCGGLIESCGLCGSGEGCGGGGVPSVCGAPDSGVVTPCTGLCTQQVKCDGGGQTIVTGTVYAPNGIEPLPNAVIYVPNGGGSPDYGVEAFSAGVSCTQCGAEISGTPLVKGFSASDGTFTLVDVPVGSSIPIVIQIGRWRRMSTITVNACVANAAPATATRLPTKQGEFGVSQNNIPLTAIATGGVDTLECVIRKIGVADSEFTTPTGGGRIQLWTGDNGASGYGAHASGATKNDAGVAQPTWTTLYNSASALANYDQMIFACNGDPSKASMNDTDRGLVRDYLNSGGRLFVTHYEYVWLDKFSPFSGTAKWNADQANDGTNPILGDIDTSFAKGQVFAEWLGVVNALAASNPPQIEINVSRHDIDPLPNPPGTGIVAPAQRWISVDSQLPNDGGTFVQTLKDGGTQPYPNYIGAPQHYTFNTPLDAGSDQQCGRVLFSDFHVANAAVNGAAFPTECDNKALTPQEKVIEFMLFDLGNCISPDTPPSCTPQTCTQLGINCGPSGDGCGGTIQCPACPNGETCGGSGTPNQCGVPSCTKTTCTAANAHCGLIGDGCGGTLDCGTCTGNQVCGGGGANTCGTATCTPRTCGDAGVGCGQIGDGCGNLISCGSCPSGQTCGGAGTPNECGIPACTPTTCAAAKANCGPIADGCGGLLQCGTCGAGMTCGAGGTPNQCSGSMIK